jgi:hypothetical protein
VLKLQYRHQKIDGKTTTTKTLLFGITLRFLFKRELISIKNILGHEN